MPTGLAESVRNPSEIERLLDQIEKVDEGCLSLDRWSGAMLTAKWAGARGILDVNRFVGGEEHRQFKYGVNPDYSGDRSVWLPLTD